MVSSQTSIERRAQRNALPRETKVAVVEYLWENGVDCNVLPLFDSNPRAFGQDKSDLRARVDSFVRDLKRRVCIDEEKWHKFTEKTCRIKSASEMFGKKKTNKSSNVRYQQDDMDLDDSWAAGRTAVTSNKTATSHSNTTSVEPGAVSSQSRVHSSVSSSSNRSRDPSGGQARNVNPQANTLFKFDN